ncbi:MAG: serine O-acetyltransferase [Candidatus Lokiarchaeota archaeon]|nr:serine O-acetyltransferase [Candidatus Lokiarchaeota archaeon]
MEEFIRCLNCGKGLGSKEKGQHNYCAECILDLKFETEELKQDTINNNLQEILNFFVSDVSAAFNKDPAANSLVEVLTSYPGVKAILFHRIAHFFWMIGMPFVPRYLSEIARNLTGVEIHPGAKIGKDFFIDHGGGVVIGETAEIGNNVTIYQGVVLGGTTTERVKRHPTLGDNIVIGSGAKLLGPIVIGENVKIGANSVVVNDVPPNSVVVGVPGRIISTEGKKRKKIDLSHGDLPDPLAIALSTLDARIEHLENKILDKKEQLAQKKKKYDIYYGEYGGGI